MSASLNHDSPNEIRDALASLGITLKKRWGQNFLVNRSARGRILALLDAGPRELVWEIGPGLGAMTHDLLAQGADVVAFEIDRGLCRFLSDAFRTHDRFTLIQGDFIKTWPDAVASGAPSRILGNLPYSSASLMIASLVEGGLAPKAMIFTVQRELGERISAKPGTKSYSSFSVLCQAFFEVESRGDLNPGSFYPSPDVVSTIIEMRPRSGGAGVHERKLLSELARALFHSRRKTIGNNILASELAGRLSRGAVLDTLREEGIDAGLRAERLEPDVFLRLVRRLSLQERGAG